MSSCASRWRASRRARAAAPVERYGGADRKDAAGGQESGSARSIVLGTVLDAIPESMMPKAFEHGGKLVGVVTTLGFAVAFSIHALD